MCTIHRFVKPLAITLIVATILPACTSTERIPRSHLNAPCSISTGALIGEFVGLLVGAPERYEIVSP